MFIPAVIHYNCVRKSFLLLRTTAIRGVRFIGNIRLMIFHSFFIKLAHPNAAHTATVRAGITRLRQKKVTSYFKKIAYFHTIPLSQRRLNRNAARDKQQFAIANKFSQLWTKKTLMQALQR